MKKGTVVFFAFVLMFLTLLVTGTADIYAAYPPSNDPMRTKQAYLDQIHIDAAWAAAPATGDPLIIAVVDTGVDLNHPDLINNLVQGVNLINPKLPPKDDNGHGTNVSGVLAAEANNDKGIAGIARNAKIMPIKAVEADGMGGEAKLGEGIRYGVDHGAKIVVLSLGLNKYSANLAGAVQYAEDHDVLLVAAVGNESNSIKYPAAYPTVLAVGGATPSKHADSRSNFGPEMGLVAPWEVFTTALGGGYEYKGGSSMSAPQVAGVASLAWGRYPYLKAYQIRDLLLQTAEDLETPGWDPTSGAGLLRADLALTQPYVEDRFEPNNRMEQAVVLSVDSFIHAEFSSSQDQDWYALESPYDGNVVLQIKTNDDSPVSVRTYDLNGNSTNSYSTENGQTITVPVNKGRNNIQLQSLGGRRKTAVFYSMQASFQIYKDPFEDNDRQYKAYVLPPRSQKITGTFHQGNDQDWFMLPLQQSGNLRLKCNVDTARIDTVIMVQKPGEEPIILDSTGEGAAEMSNVLSIQPGEYYIQISNAKGYPTPVVGEYTLTIEYTPELIDPNEPNDKPFEATSIGLSSDYMGLFDKESDVDWFQFRMDQESLMQFQLSDIPTDRSLLATVYDSAMKEKFSGQNPIGNAELQMGQPLPAGMYYIKLQTSDAFTQQMYHLQVSATPLVSGYIDIQGHWAQKEIIELTGKDIVKGYANYRFEPDRPISRAEAAVILTKAFNLSRQKKLNYTDVSTDHWAYSSIGRVEQLGLMEGYPDHTFAPNRLVTRMEMTNMLARSLKMAGKLRGNSPFTDVPNDYAGISILKQMKADGLITGFPDNRFRPDQETTRAEFLSMISRVLNRLEERNQNAEWGSYQSFR